MAVRIYRVEDETAVTLVRANSAQKALQYVAKSQYQVRIANGVDVADYMEAGGVIEDANAEAESDTAQVDGSPEDEG